MNRSLTQEQKGFTLIELLVVIAILAVLAVVVLLVLNPAQLLRQTRDSNRLQDLDTINRVLNLYMADVSTPSLGNAGNCYAHSSSTLTDCTDRFVSGTPSLSTGIATDGTGWIPVNFNNISAGSPISKLPKDPVNNATYYYAYRADPVAGAYEINARMESNKFGSGGGSDVVTDDGGDNADLYEIGNKPVFTL